MMEGKKKEERKKFGRKSIFFSLFFLLSPRLLRLHERRDGSTFFSLSLSALSPPSLEFFSLPLALSLSLSLSLAVAVTLHARIHVRSGRLLFFFTASLSLSSSDLFCVCTGPDKKKICKHSLSQVFFKATQPTTHS